MAGRAINKNKNLDEALDRLEKNLKSLRLSAGTLALKLKRINRRRAMAQKVGNILFKFASLFNQRA